MVRKRKMKGWKTVLAGGLSIVWGVGGFIAEVHDFNSAMGFVISGLGLLGVGHKLDKLISDELDD